MKKFAGPLVLMTSLALAAAGCGTDEADDVTSTDEALLTCDGWHHNGHNHRGHRHHRHHHHHGGSSGGTAGTTGTAGTGGAPVDPRCAPMDGIVSWWHADNDYDDAVGTNDGDTGGAVAFGSGVDNEAFSFNGTLGSFVNVNNSASLQMSNAITLEAWVNPTVFGGRIFDKITPFGFDGFLLDFNGAWVRFIMGGDVLHSANQLPAGMFTHVAVTFDGATRAMAVYINGALESSSTAAASSVPVNSLPLRIGADNSGGSLLTGSVDEPKIFNRAVSAAEVQTLFWQGTNCP